MKRNIYTLIIPRFEDIFHSFFAQEIIKGVSSAASHLKIDILMHITERGKVDHWYSSQVFASNVSQGILFADIDQDRTGLKKVVNKNIPCVVLNNSFLEPINCVSIDNYKSTRRVMEYLVGLGHRKIATICGDLSTESGQERLKGYNDGLHAAGIEVENQYIKKGEFLRTPARRAAEKLLSLPQKPTAIFAASDVMALEVMYVARDKKIKIPQQLSIIGFDDNPLNSYSEIKLSTVKQPIAEMASLGLETLHRIATGKRTKVVQEKLSARLIKRDSCSAV